MKLSSETALLDAALQNPEIAPFAMFELDAGAARDPQTGEALFPELGGKYTPLWNITSNGGREADRQREEAEAEAASHQRRVDEYARRVANGEGVFESPDGGDDDVAPADEWDTFWCG
jgi:hypothetical protein